MVKIMSMHNRTLRGQDADDFGGIPGAGNDGYTPVWDNDAGEFVEMLRLRLLLASRGVLSSTTGTAVFITQAFRPYPVGHGLLVVRQISAQLLFRFPLTSGVRLPKAASVVIRENNSAGALLGSAYVGLDCSKQAKRMPLLPILAQR